MQKKWRNNPYQVLNLLRNISDCTSVIDETSKPILVMQKREGDDEKC